MAVGWANSDRRERLPDDWYARRAIVRERAGGRCEAVLNDGSRCPVQGSDCDHRERGDNHELDNLQWLCRWHHDRKTAREAYEAREAMRRRNMRDDRHHPGLKNS